MYDGRVFWDSTVTICVNGVLDAIPFKNRELSIPRNKVYFYNENINHFVLKVDFCKISTCGRRFWAHIRISYIEIHFLMYEKMFCLIASIFVAVDI